MLGGLEAAGSRQGAARTEATADAEATAKMGAAADAEAAAGVEAAADAEAAARMGVAANAEAAAGSREGAGQLLMGASARVQPVQLVGAVRGLARESQH